MREVLKCDAEGCDHIEPVEAVTSDLVGKPCPKCGASLLTQEDWDAWAPIRDLLLELEKAADGVADTEDQIDVSIGYHDGEASIKFKPVTTG